MYQDTVMDKIILIACCIAVIPLIIVLMAL